MKKFLAACVLVCGPVGVAYALLPLVVGTLVMATNSTTLTTALVGSAAVVGAAVAFFGMGSATTVENSPMQVQINAAEALPTPSGWTAAVSPSVNPTPPASVAAAALQGSVIAAGQQCGYATNRAPGEYFQGAGGQQFFIYSAAAGIPAPAGSVFQCATGSYAGLQTNLAQINRCTAGYSWSGGATCNLSDAAQVMKPTDGKCTVIRVGNVFSGDPKDPDCSAGLPTTVTITGTQISARPSNTQEQKVKINGDGSVTTTTSTINTSSNTTTTTTINVSAGTGPGQTKITGIGTTTVSGTGDQAGTTPAATEFPTDYNKEATQAEIKAGIEQLNQKMDTAPMASVPTDQAAKKSEYDSAVSSHKGKIDEISSDPLNNRGISFSFSPVIPTTTCFEPVMTIGSKSIAITWCEKIGLLKEILAYVFFILTGFGIYNMVTRGSQT